MLVLFIKWIYGQKFTLGKSLLEPVELIKNADRDRYKYSSYSIWIDALENVCYQTVVGLLKIW